MLIPAKIAVVLFSYDPSSRLWMHTVPLLTGVLLISGPLRQAHSCKPPARQNPSGLFQHQHAHPVASSPSPDAASLLLGLG
jgi:hypothetical protein